MFKKLYGIIILIIILITWQCGKETPTTPQPPAKAVSITITSSSDMLYIGTSEIFQATVTYSDGSTKAVVGGTWGSDNVKVATVESSTGKVTIVGSGNATIYVDYQGVRGTKLIRGLPNYQGTWDGTYSVQSCVHSGIFAIGNFCGNFPYGTLLPIQFVLTQDKDKVQGRFYLGKLSSETNGPIALDGSLILTGTVQEGDVKIEVAMNLQSETPGKITGNLTQLWRRIGYSGEATLKCTIVDLNRKSLMLLEAPIIHLIKPTLEDVIHAILIR